MITAKHRPPLLVAALIAVSTPGVWVECAWVLWRHQTSLLSSSFWTIEGGYQTAAKCATEQARWWDTTMKELSNREKYPRIAKVEGERPKSIDVTVTKDSLVTQLNEDCSRRVLTSLPPSSHRGLFPPGVCSGRETYAVFDVHQK